METYNQLQTYVADNQRDKLVELDKSNPILFDQISQRENTLLHIAAWHNSADVAEFLLTHNTPIEEHNNKGDSALHVATRRGNIKTAYILLKCGANPHTRTTKGKLTPLHIASSDGRNNLVHLLLRFGAKCDRRNKNNATPLHHAIEANRTDCQQTLVQWGTELKTRRRSNSATLFRKLGPFTDELIIHNYRLFSAIDAGLYDQMLNALDDGAQINFQNHNGETPLHRAILKASRAMICALLVRGADPTIENFEGENAIHYGLLRGKDPVYSEGRGIPISDLLRKASSVTKGQFLNAIRQSQRKKASHYLNYVPLSGTETTFQDLVEATDHAGNNALHLAVLAGKSPGTVRTLLEHRVNPHKPNNVNKTPINLAIEIHDKSPSPENSKIFAILTEEYEDD